MGKCLSCCEETDDNDASRSANATKGDIDKCGKAELSIPADGTVGGRSDTGSSSSFGHHPPRKESRHHHHHHHHQHNNANRNSADSRLAASGNGGSGPDDGGNGNGNAERRPFYSRKPPIRSSGSGGGGDSKRSSSQSRSESTSEAKILSLYEQYRDPHDDAILMDGIERFCQDLNVKPEEFRVLVLAWKFGAETMCRFTREEFVGGCRALRVTSVRGIQNRFAEMLQEVQQDQEKFKDLYRFTFRFGLDAESGQRILPTDMAVGLWRLVLSQREPPSPLLPRWLDFLEKHPHVRGIPRDTWNMFLNFVDSVGDDLSSYDDAEAWPSLFDDFVEYENDQTNQNVQPARKERKDGGGSGSDTDRP